ncbi:tyrosine-type recombinase/integrase [Acidithiobacillus sp. M4-SHS-6]|uniref:tyrosine-type recombinase/integrase n=1 Tax=Acidithiobacillus sp. M4-SHS-6 TaxID=3383024 RepID=UPI0039BEA277
MVIVLRQTGKHPERVFTYRRKPVRQTNTRAWTKALEKANIRNFRWHDLRHTWASWHVQAGTPLERLQEMGGWESIEMVRRYAHLAPEHLAGDSAKIDSLLKGVTARCRNLLFLFGFRWVDKFPAGGGGVPLLYWKWPPQAPRLLRI